MKSGGLGDFSQRLVGVSQKLLGAVQSYAQHLVQRGIETIVRELTLAGNQRLGEVEADVRRFVDALHVSGMCQLAILPQPTRTQVPATAFHDSHAAPTTMVRGLGSGARRRPSRGLFCRKLKEKP